MALKFRPVPNRRRTVVVKQPKHAPRALYYIEAGLLSAIFVGYIGMQIVQRLH